MPLPHDHLLLPSAERERAYSPSSCTGGDYRPFVDAYRTRSLASRQQAQALGGRWEIHRYGPRTHQRLMLCMPAVAGQGLLVFIHGGYWQELSAEDSLFCAAPCVSRGLAFAAIDYTLAPEASVAEIVAECRLAVAWLLTHAGILGFDARRVVVAGSSAGAHLAAMTALPPNAAGPLALVLLSGVYWLEPLVGTSINDALGLDAHGARALSPALRPLAGCVQAVICWGEIETEAFKQQSRAFADALRAAGTACEAFEVPARNHFDLVFDLVDDRTALGQRTLALLTSDPNGPRLP